MKNGLLFILLLASIATNAQEFSKTPSIGFSTGLMNYEGDLQPNSFTFNQSNPYLSFFITQPVTSRINFRTGAGMGSIEAADRNNRGYLVPRNLSFKSNIKEAYAGLEFFLFKREKARFTPYVFLGAAVFHFNPWAKDNNNEKVFLQPLGTEGQGLADYPSRKAYGLNQYALCFAGGFKFNVSENVTIGWELNQRKTFTDHLDDVSADYVDRDKLLAAKGSKAVEMAFRGDEINPGERYPKDGTQRGTPTESDWYYMFGVTMEVKLSAIKEKLGGSFEGKASRRMSRCPVNF